MTFPITAFYAAIATILVIVLANIVSAKRAATGISILHGDNIELALWMRRHGNLMETLPFALLLMAFCEARGLPSLWLNVMGIVLLSARVLHAIGLDAHNVRSALRMVGGVATQLSMLGAAAFLLSSLFRSQDFLP